jgi:hypothetical protein
MKKAIIFTFLSLMFFAVSLEAGNHPPLTVHKQGGVRKWITFWKVTYHRVNYDPCNATLKCNGAGNETCKTGYIANSGGDWEIDGVQFDEGMMLMKADVVLDLVDGETLPEGSPSSGSISKTYMLYDKAGHPHLVSFLAVWSNSDWKSGDADIVVTTSIIEFNG